MELQHDWGLPPTEPSSFEGRASARAEHGLDGKDTIRETFRAITLGVPLKSLNHTQKRYFDCLILTLGCVLVPSRKVIAVFAWRSHEWTTLLKRYEFGLPGSYWVVKNEDDEGRVRSARLRARTWFKGLKDHADYTQWEYSYYGQLSNRTWESTLPWRAFPSEQKDEIQAGVPLSPAFFVKFWYPELE